MGASCFAILEGVWFQLHRDIPMAHGCDFDVEGVYPRDKGSCNGINMGRNERPM